LGIVVVALIVLGAADYALAGWYNVDPTESAVVYDYMDGSLVAHGQGFYLKTPGHMIDVNYVSFEHQAVTLTADATTLDLQSVGVEITVQYNVAPDSALWIYKNYNSMCDKGVAPPCDNFNTQIVSPIIQDAAKATTAHFNAVQLVEQRPLVAQEIVQRLSVKMNSTHLVVDQVTLNDFKWSDSFQSAVEQKQVAQQNALQANYTLQQAAFTAQQRVVQAEANLTAANFTAQAAVVKAQGQAKAIEDIQAALKKSPDYNQWLLTTEWNGVLPTTYVRGTGGNSSVLVGLP
jgi:regulator of protease activity HflC (stomatin/prohibitin superfamily)